MFLQENKNEFCCLSGSNFGSWLGPSSQ